MQKRTDRKQLVTLLNKVAPAISNRDLIMVFACLCFDGKTVHAWDDVVALLHPANLGITGAIRGRLLLDFLSASRAKEVEITQESGQVRIKAGRSKLDTPLLPADEFLFQVPDTNKGHEVKVDQHFLLSLSRVAASMSNDPSNPWMYGVTLIQGTDYFEFYSSNSKTVARAKIGKGDSIGKQHILPPRFVEMLLDLAKNDAPKSIILAKEWVSTTFASGLKLFSRTVAGADATKYLELFKNYDEREGKRVDIPKTLAHCLERALLPLSFAKEPYTKIKIGEGRLRLNTESPAGDVRDSIPFEYEPIDLIIEPAVLLKALPHAEKMSAFPDAIRLQGKGYTCLAATVSEHKEAPVEDEE